MNVDPLKPVGAFIENTMRPLLEELHWFFKECEKRKLDINERNIKIVVDYIARAHFRTVLFSMLQTVAVTLIICATWILSKAYLS